MLIQHRSSRVASLALAAALALMPAAALSQAGGKLKWGPAPPVFPAGAKLAVVSGSPTKEGPYTIQLDMPAGYRLPPHWHPADEHVVVKSGEFLVGMGRKVDTATLKPMKAGEKGTIKAKEAHYAMARGATVVEVSGVGPFVITYVSDKLNAKYNPPKK